MPETRDVAVRLDASAERLVAWIVQNDGFDFDKVDWRERLSDSLPSRFIPDRFVPIDSIPFLPNGKIDDSALAKLDCDTPSLKAENRLPSTPTEHALIGIWREVLSIEALSIDDDFFDLGGTSLQAIRLFSKIRARFGSKISPSRLVEFPTIEGLAKAIEDDRFSPAYRHLVPLKPEGQTPPIFLIHSGGLQVLFYKELADRIDSRIPLFGFQPAITTGREPLLGDINAMAETYLKELLAFQPQGPYVLLGHCFGVTIALEMANRLRDRGHSVPLVISIDGEAPLPPDFVPPTPPKPFAHLPVGIRQLRYGMRIARKRLNTLRALYQERFGTQAQKELILLKNAGQSIGKAFQSYRSEPYQGDVLAFKCIDSNRFPNHSEADWRRSAPKMSMTHIECRHSEILKEPAVQQTAETINRALRALPRFENAT